MTTSRLHVTPLVRLPPPSLVERLVEVQEVLLLGGDVLAAPYPRSRRPLPTRRLTAGVAKHTLIPGRPLEIPAPHTGEVRVLATGVTLLVALVVRASVVIAVGTPRPPCSSPRPSLSAAVPCSSAASRRPLLAPRGATRSTVTGVSDGTRLPTDGRRPPRRVAPTSAAEAPTSPLIVGDGSTVLPPGIAGDGDTVAILQILDGAGVGDWH